ncbi:MAG: hypothetical protein ABI206_00135, partial [Antricoccus sp.]
PYNLTESNLPGYQQTSLVCSINGGTPAAATSVTVAALGTGTCTFTNTDQPAALTLTKVVANGSSGSTNVPANWTLTATPVNITGQGPVTGNGDPSSPGGVNGVQLFAGTYTLSESGPAGFTPGLWVCTGGTQQGTTVTVPVGGKVSCSITNTAVAPRLTLVKTVDNGATGAAAIPTDWILTATGPSTITGKTGASAVTNAAAKVGTYTLSENGPGGYTPSDWTCTGGTSTTATTITLALDQSATCTIKNTAKPAALTLIKTVDNGTTGATAIPTDWTLTATGPSTITGKTGASTVTNAAVPVGTYALTETGPAGYTPSDWTCTGGTSTTATTITLALGQSATCTIKNTAKPATLTLIKTVDNGTTGATAIPTDWTLTATGPSTITGKTGASTVTNTAVPIGTYALAETGPVGYTPSDWTCTGGTSTTATTITLALGQAATCTINNTAKPAALTLIKTVDNGTTGGTAIPTDWTLTATGPSTITGLTGSGTVTNAVVPVGTYTLSESAGPDGYTPSDWTCTGGASTTATTVTLALGQSATCTITNTAKAALLTLVKKIDNGTTGGTAVPTDWTLTATGPSTITGLTGSGTVTNAAAQVGTYTLSESAGPVGYTPSDWTCTGGTSTTATTITLALGQAATCTITNTAQPAALTLAKVVDNGSSGSTDVPANWTLTATPVNITGQGPVSGNGDPTSTGGVNAVAVFAGTYTLSESGPAGFTPGLWICTGGTQQGDTVTVPLGGKVSCSITNTATAPRLTLVKTVDNGTTGATSMPTDWTLTATGPSTITGKTGDSAVTNAAAQVGTYALTETGPDGYTPSDWTCTGGASTTATTITLALDQSATCTINNTAKPVALTLIKAVDNGTTGATAVPADWTLTATGPSTITGKTGSDTVTNAAAQVGTYTLSETGPDGYSASDWTCTGGASTTATTITLALGQAATCTINNTAKPAALTLIKTVDNGTTGATAVSTDWTLTATGPSTITGKTGSATVTNAAVPVGTYALTESGPVGYTPSDWTCTGGATTTATTITLALGQAATCTITNTAKPATLTLIKKVDNGTTGATAVPTDWTLTATGPSTITGKTGASTVTNAAAQVGTYTLTETGPGGYTPSDWTCTGGASTTATTITLTLGQAATCTITNTAKAAAIITTPPPPPPTMVTPAKSSLAYTGFDIWSPLRVALGLLIAGGLALALGWRRRIA